MSGTDPAPVRGLIVPADPQRPVGLVELDAANEPTYRTLQRSVGGTIDVVAFDEADIWVNDEGRITGLPLNVRASHWALHDSLAGQAGHVGEPLMLYGDVVLTGPADDNGDATNVSENLTQHFRALSLDQDAMKDWDVRTVSWNVQPWNTTDDPPLSGPDLEL